MLLPISLPLAHGLHPAARLARQIRVIAPDQQQRIALSGARFRMLNAIAAVAHGFPELLAALPHAIDSLQICGMLELLVHSERDGKVQRADNRSEERRVGKE